MPTEGPIGELCTATRHVATVVAAARTASDSARAGDSAGVQASGDTARGHYQEAQGATDAANLLITGSGDEVRAKVREYLDAGAVSPCIGGIPGAGFDDALEAVAELI